MPSALFAFALLLMIAPLITGVANRTKAVLTGRRGAPVWQLYADLRKLARRGAVYSVTTTWAFQLAAAAVLATTLVAALLVPLSGQSALVHFSGDAVAFAYVLGLGRFLLVLGALDTGSSFEGMGASREVTFATLVEIGLFISFAALSLTTGSLTLTEMFGASLADHWSTAAPALVMIAASLFTLLLAECARVPVDDPATHLELTMIHEVMVLDHSGPDLALILYASSFKLALLGALIVRVLVSPAKLTLVANIGALVVGLLAVGIAVGIIESTMARLRLPRVPLYIAGGSALGMFGLVLLLR